ncbi:MAG TPA: succinate-semialdehyde dehydrogenase, partial [Bacteroidetes bacterium]|nr:succinate-semialdehyde dehydrogenase [Bacteroidota bacterium]
MYMSDQQLSDCLSHANDAFQIWKVKPVSERTAVLLNAASILTDNKSRFSRLITEEMGKPIAEAEAEVLKCATVCRYYAEHAEDFLRSTEIISDAQRSFVRFDALGTILAVMPWNFPFWQVFRFLAPALAAGNTAVLKHASNVLGCGEAIR